ncbi:hypothetical protein M2262_004209 [Pseudomonas sp. BIGb0408]|uniref:Uncharacterized protein n=1 Tax=Phytopseudomonas flavescens TaxID=29435 RepID=A0A7Z0BR79_9GAMM|nr:MULTISPECIES: hypothetical protein [Pseudomonas]MCW2294159.1 hypothetical protein [Pseudomonas sp. BIGb0408]NYH76567.1 hypothetical protein [Pseudomonas flavescens]
MRLVPERVGSGAFLLVRRWGFVNVQAADQQGHHPFFESFRFHRGLVAVGAGEPYRGLS